jgi:hypothetical protein
MSKPLNYAGPIILAILLGLDSYFGRATRYRSRAESRGVGSDRSAT